MKKITGIVLTFVFIWGLLLPQKAMASGMDFAKERQSIIIVMDHSGSMNVHDQHKNISQVLSTMLDVLQKEEIDVGYVAYNDTILTDYPLTSLDNEKEAEQLKAAMNKTPYKGETDIGLGLKTAYQMLEGVPGSKSILLLSDGETDLEASAGGRSREDSDRDIEEVIGLCRKADIKISTIAFGEKSNRTELEEIANYTSGQAYSASEPGELVKVLGELFLSKLSFSVKEMESSVYGAGTQKISYESSNADTITILLISEKQLKGIEIAASENGERESLPDGNYAVTEVENHKDRLTISFTTGEQQRVWAFVLEKREIIPVIYWPEGISGNNTASFSIQFLDKQGNSLLETGERDNLTWEVMAVNTDTGEEISAQIEKNREELLGNIQLSDAGEYFLYLRAGEGIGDRYVCRGIEAENNLPESSLEQNIELFTFSEKKTINLEEYIVDRNGDSLSLTLHQIPEDIAEVRLEDNELTISPLKRGSGKIKLLVSDGEGKLSIEIPVKVKSFWEAYWPVPLVILIILLLILWRFFQKKEKDIPLPIRIEEKSEGSFNGKLNAYFTRLPEDMEEIPMLTFALYPIREKKIVLKDMFADYPELIELLELDKIYFFPAESRNIIFYHECQSAIMIGNSLVCRRMQYMLSYQNVIYITSKDGKCELEVHYIAMI